MAAVSRFWVKGSFTRFKPRVSNLYIQLRYSNTVRDEVLEHHRKSDLSITQEKPEAAPKSEAPRHYKYVLPEFLPDPLYYKRDRIRERLERMDMLRRRSVIDIPEFYVGSIMAVTVADPYAAGKKNRFVGICIERAKNGLRATLTLRNVIDNQGIEITYDMYCPTVLKIEVLKLEKRIDEHLRYLRDAPLEYSTVPFDMDSVPHPPGAPVPVNDVKVKMNPYPWTTRWELYDFKGMDASESGIWQKRIERAQKPENRKEWEKYDLMKWYRESINDNEAGQIMDEVYSNMKDIKDSKTIIRKKDNTIHDEKS